MTGPQRGGVALLMAFLLLVLMSAGALATSRNVVREWATTGSDLWSAQAFLAAESGLGRAWPGLAEAPPGTAWTLPPEGEAPLDATPGGWVQRSFKVQGRCLGLAGRPGEPERLEAIWELTAQGYCTVGPSGPGAQRYRATCRAWCGCPASSMDGPPRQLAWQYLK